MTDYVNLSFTIGLHRETPDFEETIVSEACRLCGGCTVSHQKGYWVKGAEMTEVLYYGPSEQEFCIKLEMLILKEHEARIYLYMKHAIAAAGRAHLPCARWVHVTCHEVKAMHFDINEVPPITTRE